jgi:iron complex outermembrane receptor protein|tara:strand:- start:7895 stop:10090 length:2196 start_codon:yes stop_codon:yes gene_type:complete
MNNKNVVNYACLAAMFAASGVVQAEKVIEEVVVTATKKSVQLRDLAGAANVISGDAVQAGAVENVRDLIASVPSLSIGDQFGFARVFMRGIGMTSIDIGGEGAVSFLQDGAIVPRPAAQLMGMFDLDQIEVLRGPQGTLYGRGATAGAINMVTTKPGRELGGYARFTAGNFGLSTFEGAVDIPLNKDFAVRFATKIEQRDGFGENKFSGKDVDNRDARAYRATFAYAPDATWDATLSLQYYEEDDNNYAFHYFGPSSGSSLDVPLAVPILGGRTVGMVGGDFYDINSDQEAINKRDGLLANLILNFEMSETISFRSMTSIQNLDRFLRDDLDSTDVNLFGQNNYTEESDSFGQEFILNYTDNNLDIVAGVMYLEEELYGKVFVPLTNVCFLLAPATCNTPVGDGLNSGRYLQDGDVDITAYGAFAEATYAFNEQWSMVAGLRYNYEERKGKGAFIFDAAGLNLSTDQDADWDAVTPRLTLKYQTNDDMLLYLTYTEAFKSGVINTGSLSPALDPETVNAYEFGIKGAMADDRLRYSIAAFYYDYADVQISFVDATSTVSTINAAEAENYGFEVELDAELGNGFAVDFFVTYLSAEYEEFFNGDYANGFATADLSGNTLPNAPEYTAKLGVEYETEVIGGLLLLRLEGYHQDDVYFTEWNRADAAQDAYTLVNANVDYRFGDSAWMVSLWGRNLGDEEIISNNIITAPLYDSLRVGSVLPPRTFGATVSYSF